MSIYRVAYGLIFDDEFETLDTNRWRVLSPSSAVSHTLGNMRLARPNNGRSTNAMFDMPQGEENLLMQVHAKYVPKNDTEAGGIVIWENAREKVEFLETSQTVNQTTYPVWRATKRSNLWTFYAQQDDKAWEMFDSTICLNPMMMGVTLRDNLVNGYEPMLVNRVILCRGDRVTVVNMNQGQKAVLKDKDGNVAAESIVPDLHSGVSIELPTIPFEGTVEVHYYKESNDTWEKVSEVEELVKMYGGDVFVKGTDLKIKWNGKDLSETVPTHVGSLKDDRILVSMTLYNDHEFDIAENVEIKVAAYFEHFGWKWADVANDFNGTPGAFSKTIPMGTLGPGDEKDFWVKVTKGDTNDPDFQAQRLKPTNFYLEAVNR